LNFGKNILKTIYKTTLGVLVSFAVQSISAQTKEIDYLTKIRDTIILSNSDPSKALSLLKNLKTDNPEFPQSYIFSGLINYRLDNLSEVGADLKRGIQLTKDKETKAQFLTSIEKEVTRFLSPEEFDLFQKGYALIEKHESKNALDFLLKAHKLNPKNVKLLYEIGYAYVDLNYIEKAIEYLEKARSINPVNKGILAELQYCYVDLKNIPMVLQILGDRLLIEDKRPNLFHELGIAHLTNGDASQGIKTLTINVKEYPDYLPSYYALGQHFGEEKKDCKTASTYLTYFLKNLDKNKKQIKDPNFSVDDIKKHASEILSNCK